MEKDIRARLIQVFNVCGVLVPDTVEDTEVIEMDSLQYVSIFVEAEEELNIEIGDEYLNQEELSTFGQWMHAVEKSIRDEESREAV